MEIFRATSLSRAPAAALAAIGVIWGTLAAMMPQIKATLGVSDAELGTLLFMAAFGAVAAMAAAPWISERLPRNGLAIGGMAMAFSLVLVGNATGSVWIFAPAIILLGMTTGVLDILGNARVADLEARHDRALMSLNHAIYSFTYAAAAIATGIARDAGLGIATWFAIMGLTAGVLVLLMMLDRPLAPKENANKTPQGALPIVAVFAGIVTLVGFFAENATEHWSALHIERTLGQAAIYGALGPAMLGLTMGIGRLAGHYIAPRGTEPRAIGIAAVMSSIGLGIAAIAPTAALAYLGFGLLGLGISVIAPLAFAIVGQAANDATRARAVSRAAMISYGGFFFGPPVMGFIAELAGLRVAFATVAIILLVVPLALLPKLKAD